MVDYSEIIFVLTKIILALTFIASLGILISASLRVRNTEGGRVVMLLSMSLACWTAALFANLWFAYPIIEESIYASSIFVAGALALLAYTFPNVQLPRKTFIILLPATVLAGLSFVPGFLFRDFTLHPEGHTETIGGIGYYLYHALFFAYLSLALAKLTTRRNETSNATLRQQFSLLTSIIFIFAVLKLCMGVLLLGYFDFSYLAPLTPVITLLSIFLIYKIITRYYYVDLKYILYGVIGKISLFLLAGLTYLFSLLLIGLLARGHNILTYHIAFVLTILSSLKLAPIIGREAVALAAGPKEKAHREMVNNYIVDLFKQQHTVIEIANVTAQLCTDILNVGKCRLVARATGNEREIALLEHIRHSDPGFLAEPTILLLESANTREIGTQSPREKLGEELRNIYGAVLVATLTSHHTLHGILILGERKDAKGYSEQDIALIQNILLPLSSALAEATFRSEIALLTTSGSSDVDKLREQTFSKDAKSGKLLGDLRNTIHESLRVLRHKLEAIRTFGIGALDAAEDGLEKASLSIERQATLLGEEYYRPIIAHIDLAPLIHRLAEEYGAQSIKEASHFSYEIPEHIPAIGDYQQIFEALSLIFRDVFSGDCNENEYISFNVTLNTNSIKLLLSQKYKGGVSSLTPEEKARRKRCLGASTNTEARSLILHNSGTLHIQNESESEISTLITFVRDTSEDTGGIITS